MGKGFELIETDWLILKLIHWNESNILNSIFATQD